MPRRCPARVPWVSRGVSRCPAVARDCPAGVRGGVPWCLYAAVQCYAALCQATLCYAMLFYAMLRDAML
eukprot:1100079-Pyramimonas_sp.AAC.1